MDEPMFQMFVCQNPDCRLRFSSNLSIQRMEACPLCGAPLLASGEPFGNQKLPPHNAPLTARRVEVLLDNLRSTFNVGSIFRSADGAGIAHIYCCGTTPTPDHPKIIKTGLGAEFSVPWSEQRSALDVLENLAPNTLVVSLEATPTSDDLFDEVHHIPLDQAVLIILGNEVSGIDPLLLERSDRVCSLPMLGSKTSLNVAVAAGIALYAIRFGTTATP